MAAQVRLDGGSDTLLIQRIPDLLPLNSKIRIGNEDYVVARIGSYEQCPIMPGVTEWLHVLYARLAKNAKPAAIKG
jgi:hypothetical protein